MNTYEPDTTFDCIIINEAIYYARSVKAVLDRFNPYLTDEGIFIVSINGDERNANWYRMMDACTYPKIDGTTVIATRNTFNITVLGKKILFIKQVVDSKVVIVTNRTDIMADSAIISVRFLLYIQTDKKER